MTVTYKKIYQKRSGYLTPLSSDKPNLSNSSSRSAVGIKFVDNFPNTGDFESTCQAWLQLHQDKTQWLEANQNQNLIVDCHLPPMEIPQHWGTLSLKFVWEGNEYYETSKATFSVKSDRFLLLNEGTKYSSKVVNKEKAQSFTIHFHPMFWKEIAQAYLLNEEYLLDNPFRKIEPDYIFSEELYSVNQNIYFLCKQIRRVLPKNDTDEINENLANLLATIIFSQKEIHQKLYKIPAIKESTRVEIYRRITTAKDYLMSCYDKDIKLRDLGKLVAMSPHHLSRHFVKNLGKTPHQFLTEVRLQEARKLCLAADKNIGEICRSVGFRDLSSFGKLFKKRFGLPPTIYSENARQILYENH